LLLVFRCIPCEACHEFDELVVERDPAIRSLLEQFVCVRIPQANGIDLALFQYDYDMSFAVMYLHHDGTLLGRFGTRTGRDNEAEDMQLAGFGESMQRVLSLSRDIEQHRESLAGKVGPAPQYPTAEKFPSLKDKYTDSLDYSGKVVQSCIHCHQVREAERMVYRSAGKPLPDDLMYPWPSLSLLGVHCDPETATTVHTIAADSLAATAGLKPGDRLLTMNGQPLVSVADAQWVLHRTGATGKLEIGYERDGKGMAATIPLTAGWRTATDISWRVSSWDLRRQAFGGMVLKSMSMEERAELNLTADQLALRVDHVGQYGEHARAKQAGFQKGDIVVSFDGRNTAATEADLLASVMQQKQPGDEIAIEVRRGKERKTMKIRLQ
jgi:serine protease Do